MEVRGGRIMEASPYLRIGELEDGEIQENGVLKTSLREAIRKARIVGVITARNDSQKRVPSFTFLTLDDGSGTIQVKAFGSKKRAMVEDVRVGDSLLVKGEISQHNEELYVLPQHVRVLSFPLELYYRSRVILDYFLRFREKILEEFK